jgi:pimeloyl-ACP methyl ester carboxylesterase
VLYHASHLHTTSDQWVVFVHGAGGSSAIWSPQLRAFTKHFNVLLVDLRGHGKSKTSTKIKGKYTFEMIGDEVLQVLDHVGIRSAHFIGISLGTIVIREITERHPERVLSLVMGGAVMKLNLSGQFLMRLGALLKSVMPYLILYRFFAYVIMPRKRHKASRSVFVKEAKKLCQREFKRWFSLVAELNVVLALFRFKDCGVPTLFIMGSEDYMFLPSITKLVKGQSSSRLLVIPDCGHVVNLEQPEVFNHQSINFIKKSRITTQ